MRPTKTMLDLSSSLTLPFPGVPCSQTPPRSPTTSPLAVALVARVKKLEEQSDGGKA
jgi:hypothetical protein